jgi:hypothetical protein
MFAAMTVTRRAALSLVGRGAVLLAVVGLGALGTGRVSRAMVEVVERRYPARDLLVAVDDAVGSADRALNAAFIAELAASAEESSAAAGELSARGEELAGLAATFQLEASPRPEPAPSPRATPPRPAAPSPAALAATVRDF